MALNKSNFYFASVVCNLYYLICALNITASLQNVIIVFTKLYINIFYIKIGFYSDSPMWKLCENPQGFLRAIIYTIQQKSQYF